MYGKAIIILHRCVKATLRYTLYAIVAFVIGIYVQVLLCDVWRLPLWICR